MLISFLFSFAFSSNLNITTNLTSHFIWISPGCPLMSLAFQDPVHNLHSLHSLSCVPSVLCSVDYSFSPGLSWLWQSWGRLARDCRRPPGCLSAAILIMSSELQALYFEEDTTEVKRPSCPLTSGNKWQQYVLAVGMSLTESTWVWTSFWRWWRASLACCSPWCHKESDTTEQLNNNVSLKYLIMLCLPGFCTVFLFPSSFLWQRVTKSSPYSEWKWKWKLLSRIRLLEPLDCTVHGIL